MKRILVFIMCMAVLLAISVFGVAEDNVFTTAELLDAGEKYLLEGDYEQAAFYFEMLTEMLKSLATADAPVLPGMPIEFYHSSGAGGWGTTVTVDEYGMFTGYFYDSDMGDTGEDYPNGTKYECYFSGKFENIRQTNEYEYTFNIDYIEFAGRRGDVRIEDGIMIITSDPAGFYNADEFTLYLPGSNIEDLPEEYIEWISMPLAWWDDIPDVLPFYGLYNIGGEEGFYSSEITLDTD